MVGYGGKAPRTKEKASGEAKGGAKLDALGLAWAARLGICEEAMGKFAGLWFALDSASRACEPPPKDGARCPSCSRRIELGRKKKGGRFEKHAGACDTACSKAVVKILAAIARDASAPNLHKHLGVLLRDERKDLEGALAAFQAALQHDKHTHYHRSLWQRIGETRAALEDMAGTVEAIQMLARLGAMEAAQQIGGLLAQLRQKNPEAAAQLLRAQRGG